MLLRTLWLVTSLSLLPLAAQAAVQIEAKAQGKNLRLVIDREQDRVLVQNGTARALVDLAKGDVYLDRAGKPERVHVRYRPGHGEPPPYRLEEFAPGPMVAGHASRYYVLFVEDRVCAEVLVSNWMRPFIDPAVRALALLGDLKGTASDDPCADVPFATLAAAGWPLISGKIDQPTLETTSIRFDYEPAPGELAIPAPFADDAPAGSDKTPSGS
jgi:hypothetical protein